MLPLTPANNYTATILFCGGADYASNEWAYNTSYYLGKRVYIYLALSLGTDPAHRTARENSASCVQMTPDVSQEVSIMNIHLYERSLIVCSAGILTPFGISGSTTTVSSN